MRKVRCRNCGALQDAPDYHGPLHMVCKTCEWHETLPPRRALPKGLNQLAGAAFAARRQLTARYEDALAGIAEMPPLDFEALCGRIYEREGFVVERAGPGQDQTHTFELRRGNETTLLACRRVNAPIAVIDIENLAGAMRHGDIATGIFVTTGSFADGCDEIAKTAGIELIGGAELQTRLTSLDPDHLAELLPDDEGTA